MRIEAKQALEAIKLRRNVSKCRSCGAEIRWIETRKGKKIPLDLHSVKHARRGTLLVSEFFEFYRVTEMDEKLRCLPDRGKWFTSHFDTCTSVQENRVK